METVNGTHIIGDLKMCDENYLFDLDMEKVKEETFEIIKRNKMTILGNHFHLFDNNSFTGVIALSESHVAMHTWPELGVVNIDVYTCNYNRDNTEGTRKIFEEITKIFKPGKIYSQEIKR